MIKLKPIYLPFLYCIILFSSCIHKSGKTDNDPTIRNEIQTQQAEIAPVITDTVANQKAIPVIETFYKAYIRFYLQPSNQSTDSLVKKYLTRGLIEKIKRTGTATNSDPILRAQDVNEHMLKTIQVRHLEENWYMVSYDWNPTGNSNHQEIPIRVAQIDGLYMIDYITPEWNGSSYGNRLLLNTLPKKAIDSSSPLSLLKTFYTAYVSLYCSMPEGLVAQLERLRKAHLTSKALAQFEEAEKEPQLDGEMNYDLLIANFDFDCLWIPSITYTQIDENTYQMHYTKFADVSTVITLSMVKNNGKYQIDTIQIAEIK